MKSHIKVIVATVSVLLLFSILFFSVLNKGVGAFQYYHTLGELEQAISNGKADLNSGIRLNGVVKTGSIKRDLSNMKIEFILTDGSNDLPVILNRIDVSDLFKDGAMVVIEGRFKDNKLFEAEQLLAKCPTKYESAEQNQAMSPKT